MTNVRFLTLTRDGRSKRRYNFSASREAKNILKWLLNVDDFSLSYYDLKFKKAHVTSMYFRSIYSFVLKLVLSYKAVTTKRLEIRFLMLVFET